MQPSTFPQSGDLRPAAIGFSDQSGVALAPPTASLSAGNRTVTLTMQDASLMATDWDTVNVSLS